MNSLTKTCKKMIHSLLNTFGYDVVQKEKEVNNGLSFSQVGEDIIISYLFSDIGRSMKSFMELGVLRGGYCSNTYKFYKDENIHGVLVEADPRLIADIKKVRPLDTVVFAAVGINDNEILGGGGGGGYI
jgi:hypothetical protein